MRLQRAVRSARALAGAVLVALLLAWAAPAQARDVTVTSFDGTRIFAHFTPALKRAPNERVPTVLVGPGYPTSGNVEYDADTSDNIGQLSLRRAGYKSSRGTRAGSARRVASSRSIHRTSRRATCRP